MVSCGWLMQQKKKKKESEKFSAVMDGVNIIVTQSQDTDKSESRQAWREERFMFLVERNKRS